MRLILPYPMTSTGGIDSYTCSLIRELTDLIDLVVWVLPDKDQPIEKWVPKSERLVVESFNYADGISGRLLMALRNNQNSPLFRLATKLKLQLRLKELIRKHRITHCLFTSPQDLPALSLPIPVAAVVHDRNWQIYPENFLFSEPAEMDSNIKKWAAVAKAVITPSRAIQREVVQLCPEFRTKIKAVPEASKVIDDSGGRSEEDSGDIDKSPIFYFPGAARAHKGHLTLFKAAHKLASKGHQFKIVLTGWFTRTLTGYEPSRFPQVEQCRTFYLQNRDMLQNCIENLDFCERWQVEDLYRRSRRVVLPSKYEGFGLPLIEAIARGCRVICSDIEAYQEQIELYQCAEFVQLFPVDDHEALADYMEQSLIAADPQRISAQEAAAISARWTWTDAARNIVSLI